MVLGIKNVVIHYQNSPRNVPCKNGNLFKQNTSFSQSNFQTYKYVLIKHDKSLVSVHVSFNVAEIIRLPYN